MKIKSNKGVTLIVLTIMVVVLLIITGMLIYGSKSQIRTKKLNELYDDIEILNNKVSEYYLKNGSIPLVDENTPYITNTSEGKDFENLLRANGANEISFNVNDATLKELPSIISYIKQKGFDLVTLEELIRENLVDEK